MPIVIKNLLISYIQLIPFFYSILYFNKCTNNSLLLYKSFQTVVVVVIMSHTFQRFWNMSYMLYTSNTLMRPWAMGLTVNGLTIFYKIKNYNEMILLKNSYYLMRFPKFIKWGFWNSGIKITLCKTKKIWKWSSVSI